MAHGAKILPAVKKGNGLVEGEDASPLWGYPQLALLS
jgi:hypothetical protein